MSPVVEKDWVMRLAKQLGQVLARILRLLGEEKKDQAMDELERACGELLGIDYGPLAMVDSASAAALLREGPRIEAFARLLYEMAKVHALRGDEAAARSSSSIA